MSSREQLPPTVVPQPARNMGRAAPAPPLTPPPQQQQRVILQQQPLPSQQQQEPLPLQRQLQNNVQVMPVPVHSDAPTPILMARAVPVAVAAQQVWSDTPVAIPVVEGDIVGDQLNNAQREIIINARWPTPSESWGE